MFTATKEHGAFLNGERLAVSSRADTGLLSVGTGFPSRQHFTYPGAHERLARICEVVGAVRTIGSSANCCAHVACGRLTGYFEEAGLIDWAAGVPIAEEAGAVIVANKATHAYLIEQLGDAPVKNSG